MTKPEAPVLLLAGFGSFPGAPANPAERLIGQLRELQDFSATPVGTVILPVEWERSWLFLESQIRCFRPKAVLLFGLNATASSILIEMTARNERRTDLPDAAGNVAPSEAIRPGTPSLTASLPLDAIRGRLDGAGIDHAISHDAGRYLCNETLFLLCRAAPSLQLRRYGFVHTPLTTECAAETRAIGETTAPTATIEAAQLLRAARILIGCLHDDLIRARLT